MVFIPTTPDDVLPVDVWDVTEELRINRLNTTAFILGDPLILSLRSRGSSRVSSGALTHYAAAERPPQTFKLVMMSPAGGSIEQRTADGTERQVDYILVGEWDAAVEVGDYWDDERENRWEVKAIVPRNGYETRAVVEAHGKVLDGG